MTQQRMLKKRYFKFKRIIYKNKLRRRTLQITTIFTKPKEWKNKREKILKRNNYICQCCHCSNPSLGDVIVEKGRYIKVHSYDMHTGNYHIGSEKYHIDLDIN